MLAESRWAELAEQAKPMPRKFRLEPSGKIHKPKRERRAFDNSVVHPPTPYECWFDGACEPVNPGGTGAYAMVVRLDGRTVYEEYFVIRDWPRIMTNNVGEYYGLLAILRYLAKEKIQGRVTVFGDSAMVIKQMQGCMGISKGIYAPLALQAREVSLPGVEIYYRWIPREKNTECDALAERALAVWSWNRGEPTKRAMEVLSVPREVPGGYVPTGQARAE